MSAEPVAPQPDPSPAARRSGEPRSTLWRIAVGTTPVVATALTLEFGRTLVVDSFGETEVVEALASTLRVFWILLVVGGVLFAWYRWNSRRRDGDRLARTRALLDSLDKPEGAVAGLPSSPGALAPPIATALNPTETAILQLLPVDRYDSAMLLTVAAALTDVAHSLREDDTPAPGFETASELCHQLLDDQVLAVFGDHYYPTVQRTASANDEVLGKPAWMAALYALVHEHADRADAWAVALGHPAFVATARDWFGGAESELRTLVTECTRTPLSGALPSAVVPELIRIVDALDVYYGYDSRSDDLRRPLIELSAAFPLQKALLELRTDPAAEVREHHRPLAWSTSVAARKGHGLALHDFGNGGNPNEIARRLGTVWRLLPRADLHAEVCVLINLAVVELRRRRPDAAGDRLELALARTENGRDPGGRVHATEILGIVQWMRGDTDAALRAWRTAWTGYRALADKRGEGRCLRHLGSALRTVPKFAGTVIAPPPGSSLHHDDVQRIASGWLTEADRLDPGSPVGQAPGTPVSTYHPPLEHADAHLDIHRATENP
ncbi:tetratricopeptide repeat protein [Nocardia sp. NPDC050697]|uniref:tetratricopeptide repeat protein n=1 Tax=Nocardia sp. NPDC050697 TaxID=3155158 RepID=UPI003407238C